MKIVNTFECRFLMPLQLLTTRILRVLSLFSFVLRCYYFCTYFYFSDELHIFLTSRVSINNCRQNTRVLREKKC